MNSETPSPSDHEVQLKAVNESVYKHSLELAVKNKTLSLLSSLYEIATLALEGKEMAARITSKTRSEFDFEIVGMLAYDQARNTIAPLAFATSTSVASLEAKHTEGLQDSFVGDVAHFKQIEKSISTKQMAYTEDFREVCDHTSSKNICSALASEDTIRSSVLYPLMVNGRVVGVLMLSLNRGYKDIVEYEREAMRSVVGVVAIALDKVFLYEALEATNARLRDLDQQKNEFLSFASHQLRTPLTAIKWSAGAILERMFGKVPKKLTESVQTIFDESSMMAVFINDYLNVSRIEQGRMEYRFIPTDMTELLKTTASQMSPSVQQKGLTLVVAAGSEPAMILADASKLTQVVSNLIDNAIKYTPNGSITVSMHKLSHEGKVHIEIRDTGIGMDKETLSKVFDKFVRGENAKVVNGAGSGLGLFIVRTFVEAHKGTIHISSEGVGKGTLFSIEFPLLAENN